ncbi:sensor histidine kinase [Methylobacterium sp. JK268]
MVVEDALFEARIAALKELPALRRLVSGRALACLLIDEAVARVLYATPAAMGLRAAISDPEGRIDPDLELPRQLRGLRHLAPDGEKPRLSRLRVDPGRLIPPLVCACLVATLGDGRRCLAVIPIDPVPNLRPRRRPLPAGRPSQPAAPAANAAGPTVRFLWRSDAEGRIAEVTDALVEILGTSPVGETWFDLLGHATVAPDRGLAEVLEARRTFRAVPVLWRLGESGQGVAIDLSGTPRLGEGRAFAGFSGFGVIHPDRRAAMPARPPSAPQGAEAPPRPSLRERAAAVMAIGRNAPPRDAGPGDAPVPDLPAFASLAGATIAGFAGMMASAPLNPFGLGWPFPGETHPDAATTGGTRESPRAAPEVAAEPAGTATAAAPGEALARPPGAGDGEAAAPEAPAPDPAARAPLTGNQLSLNEHAAFREIARALGARFAGDPPDLPDDENEAPRRGGAVTPFRSLAIARQAERGPAALGETARLLDRLPVGILVHRGEEVLLANRALLALADYESAEALAEAGGAGVLFRGRAPADLPAVEGGHPVVLARRDGGAVPVAVTLTTLDWAGAPASLLLLRRLPEADPARDLAATEMARARQEATLREMEAVLDAVTDGVATLDARGRILSLNKRARALFGLEPREVTGDELTALFVPEGRPAIRAALERARGGEPSGTEVAAENGERILALTLARVGQGEQARISALIRDVSAARRTEAELLRAKRAAETASSHKSDFLATISHEIRTPLNAILGFTEVMMEEQFGPIGNERYRDYLRDIRSSGEHVVSLVTDLLDLAKIEAGRFDLSFTGVVLNDLVWASVSLMQAQAARQRVVVRTSFAADLRPVLADERSLRQAALNLIANAITFTDAGGQVIVSTAMTDRGGVALRVRDTGIGMTPDEIETALQPFRQVATAQNRRGRGTGLGLPLTKALVEANRGALRVTSRKNEGTLVEVLFPPARVLAG